MIDGLFNNENYVTARKSLEASFEDHKAIAGNIAHANTPGYKRVQVSKDFTSQLASLVDQKKLVQASNLRPSAEVDETAAAVSQDGNTVAIEKELLALNKNTINFQYVSSSLSSSYKQLRAAINGRSDG